MRLAGGGIIARAANAVAVHHPDIETGAFMTKAAGARKMRAGRRHIARAIGFPPSLHAFSACLEGFPA
jgi:hypothetical protein